jgi:hypothetical protein
VPAETSTRPNETDLGSWQRSLHWTTVGPQSTCGQTRQQHMPIHSTREGFIWAGIEISFHTCYVQVKTPTRPNETDLGSWQRSLNWTNLGPQSTCCQRMQQCMPIHSTRETGSIGRVYAHVCTGAMGHRKHQPTQIKPTEAAGSERYTGRL